MGAIVQTIIRLIIAYTIESPLWPLCPWRSKMGNNAIYLKTIAKMAGVSTVAVPNVMNGKYNRASKETIERIQKIVEETNYRPSATARSLALKESRIIGVVVSHLSESEAFSASPYDAQILGYLERCIRGHGYYMLLRCVQQSSEAVPIFPPGMLTAPCCWICLRRTRGSSKKSWISPRSSSTPTGRAYPLPMWALTITRAGIWRQNIC